MTITAAAARNSHRLLRNLAAIRVASAVTTTHATTRNAGKSGRTKRGPQAYQPKGAHQVASSAIWAMRSTATAGAGARGRFVGPCRRRDAAAIARTIPGASGQNHARPPFGENHCATKSRAKTFGFGTYNDART